MMPTLSYPTVRLRVFQATASIENDYEDGNPVAELIDSLKFGGIANVEDGKG
jgi:hypothetical protein